MSGGVDKIIEKIATDAMQQENEAIAAAENKRREIIKELTEQALKKALLEIEKAKKEALEQERRTRSIASLEKRKKILETKRELIDNIYQKAEEYFESMPKDRYIAFLIKIASQNGGGEISFSRRDLPLAQDVLKGLNSKNYTVYDKTAENIDSGFILKKGDITINYSLKTIIKTLSPELEAEIAQGLFNGV